MRAGKRYPATPYAGSFHEIQCLGRIERGALEVHTTHTFTADHIRTLWEIHRESGSSDLHATIGFPTWGDATITAVLRDGKTVTLPASRTADLRVSSVSRLLLRSGTGKGSYAVRLLKAPRDATAKVVPGEPQRSNRHPGPRLVLAVAHGRDWSHVAVEAELTIPART